MMGDHKWNNRIDFNLGQPRAICCKFQYVKFFTNEIQIFGE